MFVEKMSAYAVSTTPEEDTAIKNVMDVLRGVLDTLNDTECCTIEDEDGKTIDAMDIERAIDTLNSVLYSIKME